MFPPNHWPGSGTWATWISATLRRITLCRTCWLLIYHSHYSQYWTYPRLSIPDISMNQSLIHYISFYLFTGKFSFLVPVIRYPTCCNFIMHCLQNVLDIIHTEWALEVSLFWQRSNFLSWNIRIYAHLRNHPVTAVMITQLRPWCLTVPK